MKRCIGLQLIERGESAMRIKTETSTGFVCNRVKVQDATHSIPFCGIRIGLREGVDAYVQDLVYAPHKPCGGAWPPRVSQSTCAILETLLAPSKPGFLFIIDRLSPGIGVSCGPFVTTW
jgi:hypothetical protein